MRSTAASWAILRTGSATRACRRIHGARAAARTESGQARRRWPTVRCFSRRTASTGCIRRRRGRIRWSCRNARACRMDRARAWSWWMTGCITNRAWAFACTTGVCRRRSAAASGRSCITTPWPAAPEGSTLSAWRMKVITGRCSSMTREKACGTGRTRRTRKLLPGWTMSCIFSRMERSGLSMARSGRWKTVCSGWRKRGS